MFSLKSLIIVLAAAVTFAGALPSPKAGSEASKVEISPVELPNYTAYKHAEYEGVILRRTASSLPDALDIANLNLGPILGNLGKAVGSGAGTDVVSELVGQVTVVLSDLTSNVLNLGGGDVLGGVNISVVITSLVSILTTIVGQLSTIVSKLPNLDPTIFVGVFTDLCTQIISAVQAIFGKVSGINSLLIIAIAPLVGTLVTISLTISAPLSLITNLQGLLSL